MFAEIRNDYDFEELSNGIKRGITIDAWETDNDNEEGQVVATVILTAHDDIAVVWHNNGARGDNDCLQAIEEAKCFLASLAKLPSELIVSYDELNRYNENSEDCLREGYMDSLADIASNYLSDTYGFCHEGFDIEMFAEDSCVHIYNIHWDCGVGN